MSDIKYTKIVQAAIETPWAILPQKLAVIRDLLIYRAAGGNLTETDIRERLEIDAARGQRSSSLNVQKGGVAVLPLIGTIIPRANIFSESSGAVSVERFRRSFRQALSDPDVERIVIDIDSPGGQVSGVEELSTEIFNARGQKQITAVANNLAASAAYWIGTAADELIVTPTSEVGSIGVFAIHEDMSQFLDTIGLKLSLISAGKFKTEGNPFEPLGEEAKAAIQERVDDYYGMFVDAVARNRSVGSGDVRQGFGQGRVVGARDAVRMGMADRIGTLDQAIQQSGNSASIAKNIIVATTGDTITQSEVDMTEKTTKPAPTNALTLADGTVITAEEVAALRKDVARSRQELQDSKIEQICGTASDRGVSPVVIEAARQILTQLNMDAEPSMEIDLGEPNDQVKKVNYFFAVAELVGVVPGRMGSASDDDEITYAHQGEAPATAGQNPYVNNAVKSVEEAEELARKRRIELGLKRDNKASAPEID